MTDNLFGNIKKDQNNITGHENGSVIRFSLQKAMISMVLFAVLAVIALFIRDNFIRPFLGDVLVVIWLYYLISTIWSACPVKLTFIVVSFAFLVEIGQYFQVLRLLELDSNSILRIILGATFDWLDLLAYSTGGGCCLILELKRIKSNNIYKSRGKNE